MVRFVHAADLQLGMSRRFLAPEAQARFAQARIDAIRAIGRVVRETGAEFVVVSGDVFESNHVDRRVVGRALEAFATVPAPVLLLPGNHDPLDGGSVYRSAAFTSQCPPNVVVLDGVAPHEVRPGVEVVAAPWMSKRPVEDLAARACGRLEAVPGTVRILAAHGSVDTLFPERRDPALIALAGLEAAIAADLVHYVALGDRHSATDVGRTGRVHYSGAPEPTDYDETAPGQVLVVDVDRHDVRVEAHHVGTWVFHRHDMRVDGAADVDALAARLDAFADKGRSVVRLGLVGNLTLRERARLDDLLDRQRPLFASLETWAAACDLTVVPDDLDAEALGVTGFAHAALHELECRAADRTDVAAADALALAYRLTGHAA